MWPNGCSLAMNNRPRDPIHQPVLAAEVADLLITDREGAYLDLTAGGGGHMKVLAKHLGKRAELYVIDRDPKAVELVRATLDTTVQFRTVLCGSFGDLSRLVRRFERTVFDGVLMDLGLSSYQLAERDRGFSFQSDGPLDMRFSRSEGYPASELIANYDQKELTRLFRDFGEERQAARIASAIVKERQKVSIRTTGQLSAIVRENVTPPHQTKALARIFQALRIAVNGELNEIQRALPQMLPCLKSGGRLVVISYHSLEDRLIKRFLQTEVKGRCTCPPDLPACICGATPTLKLLFRKPTVPGKEEIAANPRARSARLRVGEKL